MGNGYRRANAWQMKPPEITDEIIMPDGRPFFAWNNELSMLRQHEIDLASREVELNHLAKILGVVRIEREQDQKTLDITIKIKCVDMLKRDRDDPPEKYWEVGRS